MSSSDESSTLSYRDDSRRRRSVRRRRSARSRSGRGHERRPNPSSGERVLTFGQHSGKTYEEVLRTEPGYCNWALRLRNPRGDLMHFARWLRSRRSQDLNLSSTETEGEDQDITLHSALAARARQYADFAERQENLRSLQMHMQMLQELLQQGPFSTERQQLFGLQSRLQNAVSAAEERANPAAAAILAQLPRLEYCPRLFSGDPHPESCPICIEDFGPAGNEASSSSATPAAASSGAPEDAEAETAAGPASTNEIGTNEIVLTPCLHVFHAHCLGGWLKKDIHCPSCRWDLTDTGDAASRSGQQLFSAGVHVPAPPITAPPELVGTTLEISDGE